MKTKNIKVAYTNRYNQNAITAVPKIQMEGHWLEQLGFTIGTPLIVEYEENSIHIRTLTAEEQAEKEQQKLQAEIEKMTAKLEKMKAKTKRTSNKSVSASCP